MVACLKNLLIIKENEMDFGALLEIMVPVVVTFLLGLFLNKPGYKKGKKVLDTVNRVIADDKLTPAEYEELKALFTKE